VQGIAAFVVYLLQYQFVPEDRLVELMADLFGVKLAAATLARMSALCAQRFHGVVTVICQAVKTAAVKHLDETGFRIGGKTRWLHVAVTEWLSCYRVSPKRGSLLDGLIGIVVHDHWKPYYTLTGVIHALCNAHHLRERKALIEIEQERWAARLYRLLRHACHATNWARARGEPLKQSLVERFQRRFDAILADGLAFHEAQPPLPAKTTGSGKRRGRPKRRTGHNLALRLQTRRDDVLRFLTDPRVPFSRVEVWRGNRRSRLSVPAPFVRRCLTSRSVVPFPHPARRTRRADFPQRALFQGLRPSHSNGRRGAATGVSVPTLHTGTGRDIGGTPFPVCRAYASTRSADVAPRSCRSGGKPAPPVLG